ncbi:hypothetical protein UFOVP386_46 [uncultured Caudovirales phage]|uniref:Uncharacterized protein n=1 Tax=uncultured Caudovirales phage TaxID=2100421 RepID=A0A6J7X1K3_9CAUD|nr:hypothetical protein UFOVP386_46 [uncultured Caudovirales phage]
MESFVIQRAIQLLNDGLASQELNPSILYAELQELLLLEKQNLESAYRWGFNDGCRYTNRVNPFYVTANDFVTKNFR